MNDYDDDMENLFRDEDDSVFNKKNYEQKREMEISHDEIEEYGTLIVMAKGDTKDIGVFKEILSKISGSTQNLENTYDSEYEKEIFYQNKSFLSTFSSIETDKLVSIKFILHSEYNSIIRHIERDLLILGLKANLHYNLYGSNNFRLSRYTEIEDGKILDGAEVMYNH